MNKYFVYILASNNNTPIYLGVTNNIERRIYEHKNNLIDGFSKKYNTHKLVYLEETNSIENAIKREKQLKGWKRNKKDLLINSINPNWQDLSLS